MRRKKGRGLSTRGSYCRKQLYINDLRLPKLEAAGIEPAIDSFLSLNADCGCDFCQGWRAANALQMGGPVCLLLTSVDADLQRVIEAWDELPAAMRRAVLALVGADRQACEE
jgi:hypothetical protein